MSKDDKAYNPFKDVTIHQSQQEDQQTVQSREAFNPVLEHYDTVNGFKTPKNLSEIPGRYRSLGRLLAAAAAAVFVIFLILTSWNHIWSELHPGKKSITTLTFAQIAQLNETQITEIQFRNGGSGYLYDTRDPQKIKAFWDHVQSVPYVKAAEPEPSTGYLYNGTIYSSDELKMGYSHGMLSVNQSYYQIEGNGDEYFRKLNAIVESFGKVEAQNGNIP